MNHINIRKMPMMKDSIVWTVVNSSNMLRGGEVKATLPSYVRWIGIVAPPQEQVIFNETERTVLWKLGDVTVGTGITIPAREVSFQIGFLPSVSHIGEVPLIVSGALFEATDSFAGVNVNAQGRAVDTRLDTDPQFSIDESKVVQ